MTATADFWARRKAAVRAEHAAEQTAAEARAEQAELAAREARSDAEILAELDLPDPDSLIAGDDIRGFMARAVPERLKRRALRRLWTLNPVLANLDGLVDYGDDFTDAAVGLPDIKTAYQVGKGMLSHIQALADAAEKASQPPQDSGAPAPADAETAAEIPEPDAPMQVAEAMPAAIDPETDPVAPAPRRMRFAFEDRT